MDNILARQQTQMPILSKLMISPAYKERLKAVEKKPPSKSRVQVIPKKPDHYEQKLQYVVNAAEAAEMLDFAQQRALSAIGIDFEFQYDRPGVFMKKVKGKDFFRHDPRSVVPLLMSVAMAEIKADGTTIIYPFVIDLRQSEVHDAIGELLRLPVPFVAHFAQAELTCIWKLNLPLPPILWDSWVAEKAFCLGLYHARYENAAAETELEQAIAAEEAEEKTLSRLNLASTCLRRGIHYQFSGDKERLQRSFLDHPLERPFSDEQIKYASADAMAAAQLYPTQVQVAVQQGCLRHLETVEMPWTVTNAQIVWNGVRVDPARVAKLSKACAKHIGPKQAELADLGLQNVQSPKQVQEFFRSLGLLEYFRQGKGHSFDDTHLKTAKDLHPAISKIRTLWKIIRLSGDKLFTGELIGADGRLHPDHRQLGTETGRNAMRWPNVGGLGRALRPLVVPESGFAIGEVDLSQIEVGIAAAVYNDPDLISMFNGQDVYVAMAKRFYADKLTPVQTSLPDQKFKKQCSRHRDKMKTYTLAIIYGVTAIGLSAQLAISKIRAEKERDRFLQMFPKLTHALQEAAAYGAIRGCAYLCSGLRRYRGRNGHPSHWERNWLINTPVQGSAGVVFKVAGNRLRLRYEHYGAKIILPMHDAFVFECPKKRLQTVAEITAEVMRSTVQEYFPVLDPKVDVNIKHPHCWNKDGKHRSLEQWMIDPDLALR